MTKPNTTEAGGRILYADIKKSSYSNRFLLVVMKCPICGMRHNHSGEEGHRSAHCFDKKTGRSLPVGGYTLKVDWDNPKNVEQRAAYEHFLASLLL